MMALLFVALVGVTLLTRVAVELAIASSILPDDPDRHRLLRFILVVNGIVHPVILGAIAITSWHRLWDLLILTPLLELGAAALKATLFARVGAPPDRLAGVFTGCFASAASAVAAILAAWVVLFVFPI
jgi:hypothetical protein